ncbi:MAG: tail fiber domain-containing protein [Bacteroidota bacterium]|nr:tail fiber domain-containing protein [Bacteroidota bacterium]
MKKIPMLLMAIALSTATQAQSWSLTGNAGTNPSTNFLGTTDNQPLRFRTNNAYSGEINSSGKTAFGFGAGQNANGTYSVAIGYMSLFSNPGYENTAVGSYTMTNSYGGYNSALGYGVLYNNTSGNANTGMGYGAFSQNTSGYNNTAIGFNTMRSNSYGNNNTAVGYQALFYTTGSQYNTAVGYNAGVYYDLGYNNTILGANCGGSFAGQYNMVAIGQGVVCPDNSTARIGNSATWSIGGYAGWSNFSDGRYKKDIKEDVKGLDFIMRLRPVTYRLNVTGLSQRIGENHGEEWNKQMKDAIADKEKIVFTGFVAQEVEKAAKEAGFTFSGVDKPRNDSGLYALRYAEFVVPLVKAMQEQQEMIKELQSKVQTLEGNADVAIVLRENAALEKINTYPDPVSSAMTVSINTQRPGAGTLSIYDAGGKLVRQTNITIQQGLNTFNLSLPSVASGYYMLNLDWGNGLHKAIPFVKTN